MDTILPLLGILCLQVVSGQFFPGIPPPTSPVAPFAGAFPGGPAFDQAATDSKYQPGKCLTANITSNLVEFGRCVREIIDPILSSEGARRSSFQEIYEMLSFRLFGQPPQVSFEQPPNCRKIQRSGESRVYVRLVDLNGDVNRDRGRVQVSLDNNNWGAICDDSWDERDAEVVCKMLGHNYNSNSRKPIAIGGGAAVPGNPGPGPFGLSAFMCTMMDAVDCIGFESHLGQCGWISNSPSRCNHYEDAAVDCNPDQDYREFNTMMYRDTSRPNCMIEQDRNRRAQEQRNIEVRLVDGKRKGNKVISGRVEVRSRSGWGSVCDDDFDDDDAMVICRQLRSLSEDRRRKPRAYLMGAFGSMNQDACISMDDLHCTGNEDNLGKCHHSGATGHNCQHNEDAAVDCNTYPYDVKLESVTRTSDYTVGVLMVSNDDRETYGAVTDCYDFPTWNEAATQVARKRLRNVPRDCTAVWVTDTCMEDFRRSNPPTPLMHQVVCNSTADDLGLCESQPRLAAFTTCPSTLAIGLFCTNSGRSLPRGCQAVGSRMPPGMPFGPQGFNDTFGPQMPLGSPFGPAGLGAPQFGSPIPMFPFNRTQMNSPFPGAQPFPTSPFQPGFPQRNPGVGPGRLGGNLQMMLRGCRDAFLLGRCQAGVLLVGNPPTQPFGTVCRDGDFTNKPDEMARRVCGWLSNSNWTHGEVVPASTFTEMQYEIPQMVIGMDDLQCGPRSRSLSECTFNPWGAHNCDHSKDVALVCGTSQIDLQRQKAAINRQGARPQGYQFQPQFPPGGQFPGGFQFGGRQG